MTITGQSSLSRDEIERMVRDAEAHAEEDRRRREEADTRNQADSLVYQTDKLLRDQGDTLAGDDKSRLEADLATLKQALEGSDLDAIRGATQTLMGSSQGVAERLYQQASAEGGQPGIAADPDDEVVDAEIVDEAKTA